MHRVAGALRTKLPMGEGQNSGILKLLGSLTIKRIERRCLLYRRHDREFAEVGELVVNSWRVLISITANAISWLSDYVGCETFYQPVRWYNPSFILITMTIRVARSPVHALERSKLAFLFIEVEQGIRGGPLDAWMHLSA